MAGIILDPTRLAYGGLALLGWPSEGQQFGLSAAGRRAGIIFKADRSERLDGVKICTGDNNGTVTNIAQADLYAVGSDFEPTGASLATSTFTPGNNNYTTVAFSAGYTVTSGVYYCIVFKNTDGSPGSNNWAIRGSASYLSNIATISVDSGSTWNYTTHPAFVSFKLHLNYQTSGTVGYVMASGSDGWGGQAIYSTSGVTTRRSANKWNFSAPMRLVAVGLPGWEKNGSPTFDVCGEISSASASLLTTPMLFNLANVQNTSALLWFDDSIDGGPGYPMTPGTDYYAGVVGATATAGDSSNYMKTTTTGTIQTPSVVQAGQIPISAGYESTNSGTPSWSAKTYGLRIDAYFIHDTPAAAAALLRHPGLRGGFPL